MLIAGIWLGHHHGCDLITMASHGRNGITGERVGSETAQAIIHCKIPVPVYR